MTCDVQGTFDADANASVQMKAFRVTVSGRAFTVPDANVANSVVLRALRSAEVTTDDSALTSLPLERTAFCCWLQGADDAPQMLWDAFYEVLRVRPQVGSVDGASPTLQNVHHLVVWVYIKCNALMAP